MGSTADVFSLPMNVRFRGVSRREGVLIHGPAGVGEFSPFAEYDDEESTAWLAAALEAARGYSPELVRGSVHVNCTVPAVDPGRAAKIVNAPHGCRTARVPHRRILVAGALESAGGNGIGSGDPMRWVAQNA